MLNTYKLTKEINFLNIPKGTIVKIDDVDNTLLYNNIKSDFSLSRKIIKNNFAQMANRFKIGETIRQKSDNCIFRVDDICFLTANYVLTNLSDKNAKTMYLNFDNDSLYEAVKLYYFISVRKDKISIQKAVIGDDKKVENMRKAMKNYFLSKEKADEQLEIWLSTYK